MWRHATTLSSPQRSNTIFGHANGRSACTQSLSPAFGRMVCRHVFNGCVSRTSNAGGITPASWSPASLHGHACARGGVSFTGRVKLPQAMHAYVDVSPRDNHLVQAWPSCRPGFPLAAFPSLEHWRRWIVLSCRRWTPLVHADQLRFAPRASVEDPWEILPDSTSPVTRRANYRS